MFGIKITTKKKYEAAQKEAFNRGLDKGIADTDKKHEGLQEQAFYRGRDKGIADVIYLFKSKDKIYGSEVEIQKPKTLVSCVFLDGFSLRSNSGKKIDMQKFYLKEDEKDLRKWLKEKNWPNE